MTSKLARREFLRRASALSVLGAGSPFALNLATIASASAQTAPTDYRALVCLFMFGGNDSFNTVLATDSTSWNAYTTTRSQAPDPIALPVVGTPPDLNAAINTPARVGGPLAIVPNTVQAGRSFALHPALPWVKSQFDAGRAAIVANVGPLIAPTTKTQYQQRSVPLPAKLFSHNDQVSTWQAFGPEGARAGWGGRMGDLLASTNGTNVLFTAISTSGAAVWLSGNAILQYRVGSSGPVAIQGISGSLFGSSTASTTLRSIITASSNHLFEDELANVTGRAIDAEALLRSTMPAAGSGAFTNPPQYTNPATGTLANNGLAVQLQTVARLISAQSALGLRRQVFFVSIGGFDTHDFQNRQHPNLLAQIDAALSYFYGVLAATGYADKVTTFTASDFGRTFTSNGDGTDHGWGAHHFVIGNAVRGKDIYGRFPIVGLNHSDEVGSGSLLPTVSVDQYAATLGRWFGVSGTDLSSILPNLGNFSTTDLGFML